MAAIARVKRKRNAETIEAFLVSSKKSKSDSDSSDQTQNDVKSIFIFAGTASKSDIPLSKRIKDVISKNDCVKKVFTKVPHIDIFNKSKKEQHLARKASRYKLVGTYRNVDVDELDKLENCNLEEKEVSGNKRKAVTDIDISETVYLYDIEHEEIEENPNLEQSKATQDIITCNNVPMVRKQIDSVISVPSISGYNSDYVYDLYYLNDPYNKILRDFNTIEPYKIEFAQENNFDAQYSENFDEEEDSNDEDNWRNDYPDEDTTFDKEYNYDYDDEDVIDDIASCTLHEADSDTDVKDESILCGDRYARYKARKMKELGEV